MTYYDEDVSANFGFGGPRPTSGLRGVCVHTSEGNPAISARDLAHYQWASETGSYNVIVDLAGRRVLCNTDDWRVWASGNQGNDVLLHVCFTAQAAWSRAQWLAQERMLRAGATVVAHWCKRYGFPARKVTAAGLPGVLGHTDTRVWGGTDHTDPGPNFPYDLFLQWVQDIITGAPAPSIQEAGMDPEQDRIMRQIKGQLTGSEAVDEFTGWPQLGGRTVVDALAAIGEHLSIDGFKAP